MCEKDRSTSIRKMSQRLNISKNSVQLILKENSMLIILQKFKIYYRKIMHAELIFVHGYWHKNRILLKQFYLRINPAFCAKVLLIRTIPTFEATKIHTNTAFKIINISINLWTDIQNNLIVSSLFLVYIITYVTK